MTARRTPPPKPAPDEPEAPASPAQREAEGIETIEVEWRGVKLAIPSDVDDWSYWRVIVPLSRGNETQALIGLIGEDQAQALRRALPDMTAKDGRALFDAINTALGMAPGN